MFTKSLTACLLASALWFAPAAPHILHWVSHLPPAHDAYDNHESHHQHAGQHCHENDDHHVIPVSEQIPAVIKNSIKKVPAFSGQPAAFFPAVLPSQDVLAGKADAVAAHAPPGMVAAPGFHLSTQPTLGPPSF